MIERYDLSKIVYQDGKQTFLTEYYEYTHKWKYTRDGIEERYEWEKGWSETDYHKFTTPFRLQDCKMRRRSTGGSIQENGYAIYPMERCYQCNVSRPDISMNK
jgi:hypothetical protein